MSYSCLKADGTLEEYNTINWKMDDIIQPGWQNLNKNNKFMISSFGTTERNRSWHDLTLT